MGLRTAYRQARQGIRIPYRADAGGNHGFIDVRGRPDFARRLPEAAASAAFGKLLANLAAPQAPIVSLGCDLGAHEVSASPAHRRHVAGGYLHVVSSNPGCHEPQTYHRLAKAVEAMAAGKVGNRNWELAFILQDIEWRLDGTEAVPCPSLSIGFYAAAPSEAAAIRSREALIGTLDTALASADVLDALQPVAGASAGNDRDGQSLGQRIVTPAR